jgi:hypothetical protein
MQLENQRQATANFAATQVAREEIAIFLGKSPRK